MSRLKLIALSFACSLFLTIGATWRVMLYISPPHDQLAHWLPFIVLLRAHEVSAIGIWLFQFPALAAVFVLASHRWPARWVLGIMLVGYIICSLVASHMLAIGLWR